MKACFIITLILSSIFLSNSASVVAVNDTNSLLKKCAAESILDSMTKMINTFKNDRTNISSLISETKRMISGIKSESIACLASSFNEIKPLTSKLSEFGYLLLLTSNCLKDVGPVFIFLDSIISMIQEETKDWQNIIVNSVFLGLLTNQSYNDCKSLYDSLIDFIRSRN
jgi:hypothetical protein